jgi:hypothetical protein
MSKNIKKIQVAVISTFGHCGIDWLHSLIDSHKQVLIIPSLSFFRRLDRLERRNKIYLDNDSNEKFILENITKLIFKNELSNKSIRHVILKKNQKKSTFKKYMLNFIKSEKKMNIKKKFFLAIHYAYAKINKINLKDIKVIVAHEHVPWNCEKYEKYFNTKYIFMMRDPRASIAGCIKAYAENRKIPLSYYMDHQLSFLFSAQSFYKKMKKEGKILILKNETMHQNLKKEMKKLSMWLEIKFSQSLLNSTLNGKRWIGESVYLSKGDLKKPYPKNYYLPENVEKRWKSILSEKEIFMIETLAEKIMKENKYKFYNKLNLINRFINYTKLFLSFHDFNNFFPFIKLNFFKDIIRRFFVIFLPKYSRKIFDIA